MPIQEPAGSAGARSPQLPLQIPSGRVHAYFVQPEMKDKNGVLRSVLYYTDATGKKFKFMAKNETVRKDLIALGARADLADVDEEFTWAKGGSLTIRLIKK